MNLIPITALNTPELALYRDLRGGAISDNLFIADSPKVVNLLLEDDRIHIKSLLATPEYYDQHADLIAPRNIPACYAAPKPLMESIIGHTLHYNVMLCAEIPNETPIDRLGKSVVMFEGVSSSENIGAIARSAAAFGVASLLLPAKGPHPYGRRAIRVSMGYACRLGFHRYDNTIGTIKHLQQLGYTVIAAEIAPRSVPLGSFKTPEKWALLLGREGYGLSDEVLQACDAVVHIEMAAGVKSLNVAAAAGIMMHRFQG